MLAHNLLHEILDDAREGGYLAVNRLHQSRALQPPKAIREDDEGRSTRRGPLISQGENIKHIGTRAPARTAFVV
jgi:hypothetical protein